MIQIQYDLEIPMRDGVILRANMYRPNEEGSYPAVLMRLPYDKNKFEAYWQVLNPLPLVRAGYCVLIQDCRGTGASDGQMDFDKECQGKDGYDTVEWIAAQPWCTGDVGMYGLSYFGFTQLLAAQEQPPHLRTICPWQQSGFPKYSGGFTTGAIHLLWLLQRVQDRLHGTRHGLPEKRAAELRALVDGYISDYGRYMCYLPLAENPAADIPEFPQLQDYVRRIREYDDPACPAREGRPIDFSKIEIPCFFLGGWYDDTSKNGPIDNWLALKAESKSAKSLLVMGPWNHGEKLPETVGVRNFTGNSALPCGRTVPDLLIHWFDIHLKHVRDDLPEITYFEMGSNRWHTAKNWPPRNTSRHICYLHSSGDAADCGGWLNCDAPEHDEAADHFLYDPLHPAPSRVPGISAECQDQQPLEAREDVLVYTSEPLSFSLAVTGTVSAELFVSSSCPDTDFMCRLTEVLPDGSSVNITEGAVRVSYNNTYKRNLLKPGEIRRVIVHMGNVCNQFAVGNRIRLDITSSSFPKYDRNQNTAMRIGASAETAIAENAVHHSTIHASNLRLTIFNQPETMNSKGYDNT